MNPTIAKLACEFPPCRKVYGFPPAALYMASHSTATCGFREIAICGFSEIAISGFYALAIQSTRAYTGCQGVCPWGILQDQATGGGCLFGKGGFTSGGWNSYPIGVAYRTRAGRRARLTFYKIGFRWTPILERPSPVGNSEIPRFFLIGQRN